MKKILCALLTLALLLCGLAVAEGRTVQPMAPEIDLAALADGTYGVAFQPDDLADGALKCTVYTEDCYDIVDISTLEVGDTIWAGGVEIEIKSLERDDDLLINGGIDEDGYNLRAYDEDNCWKMALEDDYATWTDRGETTLPLADGVTFTDGWNIDQEPVTATGAEAVAEAIHGTDMDSFICLNTTVRVEGGKVVEIVRAFMP